VRERDRESVNEKDTRESVYLQFASSIRSARDGRARGLLWQQQNSAHSPTGRIRTVFGGLGGEECYTHSRIRKYEFGLNLKSSRVRRFASFTRCRVYIALYSHSHHRGPCTPSSQPWMDENDRWWKWWPGGGPGICHAFPKPFVSIIRERRPSPCDQVPGLHRRSCYIIYFAKRTLRLRTRKNIACTMFSTSSPLGNQVEINLKS